MSTNQPKFSQIDKRTQDKAKVSLLYLHCIFFVFKINQFFSVFFVSHTNPYKIESSNFPGLARQWSPYSSYSFTRNLQRWIKVRSFVIPVCINPLHSGAFVAYSGVTLVSFRFITVPFQLVPVYSGIILVHSVSFRRHSGSFWYHSCPLRFIPPSFRYIPVYSVPFHSVPVFSNARYLVAHPLKWCWTRSKLIPRVFHLPTPKGSSLWGWGYDRPWERGYDHCCMKSSCVFVVPLAR